MSTALKAAIVARLNGDTGTGGLVSLLAKDPNDGTSPAIFDATKNTAPPVYDCLTFRASTDNPDNRFRPGVPGAAAVQQIGDAFYDFEAWTQTPDAAPIENIGDRLDALLHQVAFTTSEGMAFWSERVTAQTDLYDDKLNAWYGLFRYHIRYSKG